MFLFFKGFFLSISIRVSIGTQNIHILKYGINKTHIIPAGIICSLYYSVVLYGILTI
ncbi:MAG: hypothetical protein AB8U61_01030 [Rickettsiales endosymbiont of Dermacentor nuttalli]